MEENSRMAVLLETSGYSDDKSTRDNTMMENPNGPSTNAPFSSPLPGSTWKKTTTSLALISGLKSITKVGFLCVGQQHVEVKSENLGAMIRVDRTCVW
jgi:hypothetical protein